MDKVYKLFTDQDEVTKKKRLRLYIIGGGVLLLIIIIIIIVAASSSSEDVSGLSPFEKYLKAKTYIYMWSYPNMDNFIQFAIDHKFSRVYWYVGCYEWNYEELINGQFYNSGEGDAKTGIKKLIDNGIEVEPVIYLNDKPNDFSGVENMEKIAKAMSEVQKSLKFTALHYDVEPSNPDNYEALLKMYETGRKYLKVSAILKPAWLNQKMGDLKDKFKDSNYFNKFKDCETYIDALMMVTDYSDLMAYNCQYETVNNFLSKFKEIKKRHPDHESKPVLELDPAANQDSLYDRYVEDHDKFFNYVYQVSKDFDGVCIHQYMAWYTNLYCNKPEKYTEYSFEEPKKCD